MKVLIMAGGGGTRLWPLSRNNMPKQFYKLMDNQSLLQMTFKRLAKIEGVKKNDIYISSNKKFLKDIEKQIELPKNNIILEPAKRDNAAAIGLSLLKIRAHSKRNDEIIGMFPSDHLIQNETVFASAIQLAQKAINQYPDHIVTLGIRPTYPETGFGYIKMESEKMKIHKKTSLDMYKVNTFIEKPSKDKADIFVKNSHYVWNAGIFLFRIDTMLSLYEKHLPQLYKQLLLIEKSFSQGIKEEKNTIEIIYPTLQAISLDYGIMEKTKKVFVIPVDHLGWNDVGSFKSLWDVASKDVNGNVIKGKKIIVHHTKNSFIQGDAKTIACLGLQDVIIIDTKDALFIADKNESQHIKELLEKMKNSDYSGLL